MNAAELMARCVREAIDAEEKATRPGRAARLAALREELRELTVLSRHDVLASQGASPRLPP